MAEEKTGPVIGIDLGTMWQAAQDRVEIIANDMGNRTTPSCVAFDGEQRHVGEAAKSQAVRNPANTVFDAKRLIGRKFSDAQVQIDMKHWPFKVVENDKGAPVLEIEYDGKKTRFEPEEISAMILSKMKATAETHLGCEVTKAVITVPAYFNDSQRQATKDAGQIAGLEVLRIINEPTAAALAYGLDKKYDGAGEKYILIFDLGGGTFDVSLLSVEKGLFRVRATAGNTHLGGDDFDKVLVQYCQDQFKKKHRKDISKDVRAITRLLKECETAKRTLSATTQTVIEVPSLHDGIDFSINIRAAHFEEMCQSLFNATLEPVEKVLADAELDKSQVDEIVLVGGSTRIPKVRKIISDFFGGKTLNSSINADEAVAYGAAAQGAILSGTQSAALADILLVDVVPLSLGIAVETRKSITAKARSGQDSRTIKKLIRRNTIIPFSVTDMFTTSADDQREVQIEVYQGERTFAKDNHPLGKFRLGNLPKAKAGTLRIEVTYAVDNNGILTVSAKECSGAASPKVMTIKNDNMRLSPDQIEKMIADAHRFEERDKDLAARQAALNDLEVYIASEKARLRGGLDEKLEAADRRRIWDALEEEDAWMKDHDEEGADCSVDEYLQRKQELMDLLEPILRAAELQELSDSDREE